MKNSIKNESTDYFYCLQIQDHMQKYLIGQNRGKANAMRVSKLIGYNRNLAKIELTKIKVD